MQVIKNIFLLLLSLIIFVPASDSQPVADPVPVARWSFDSIHMDNLFTEAVTGASDTVNGYKKLVNGVKNKCLKLDGYTTKVTHHTFHLPDDKHGFSVSGWVALQALPWNWSPIINQVHQPAPSDDPSMTAEQDFFLGIDAYGHAGFSVRTANGEMRWCISSGKLPLLLWNHLTGTWDGKNTLRLYINGQLSAVEEISGHVDFSGGGDILLGMNSQQLGPTGSERKASANILSDMVLYGLLDEVGIYPECLNGASVNALFEHEKPGNPKPLDWNRLPSGPGKLPARFDAYSLRLRYTDEWEEPWRVDDHPDILIGFDRSLVRYLFWRGTGYGGVWVTENGRWMGDQSLERANKGKSPLGCAEHMSDKHTRYSRVAIIEKNDARIVIHWRYAVSDILYNIFGAENITDWGEWADEYYYIYPDGVSTRSQVLYSDHLSHEWQETIVINQPGTKPEDNIQTEAMTVGNMKGLYSTYSWAGGPPDAFPAPKDICIQRVNLRSEYKPFIIYEEGVSIKPFRGSVRPEYSIFPWWNHWPVAQLPNDGRFAFGPGRPSHSSLSQAMEGSPVIRDNHNGSFSAVTLTGMTNRSTEYLTSLARSWNHAPNITMESSGYKCTGYNKKQRAFMFENLAGDSSLQGEMKFFLHADTLSPALDPCFVVKNWGHSIPEVTINGKNIPAGNDFRYGFRSTVEGTELVVWIGYCSTEKVHFGIEKKRKKKKRNADDTDWTDLHGS